MAWETSGVLGLLSLTFLNDVGNHLRHIYWRGKIELLYTSFREYAQSTERKLTHQQFLAVLGACRFHTLVTCYLSWFFVFFFICLFFSVICCVFCLILVCFFLLLRLASLSLCVTFLHSYNLFVFIVVQMLQLVVITTVSIHSLLITLLTCVLLSYLFLNCLSRAFILISQYFTSIDTLSIT